MKEASIKRTLFRPLSFFRQMASSSRLSSCAGTQEMGGLRYRSQFRQKLTVACFGMPSVISTVALRHCRQRFALFGVMGVPQSAQRTRPCWGADGVMYSISASGKDQRGSTANCRYNKKSLVALSSFTKLSSNQSVKSLSQEETQRARLTELEVQTTGFESMHDEVQKNSGHCIAHVQAEYEYIQTLQDRV